MFMKAYTAIIRNDDNIKAIDMMVSPGDEARSDDLISESHPGYSLVALVPGQHARWSHVYMTDESINTRRKNVSVSGSSKSIDVWEVEGLA